LREATAAIAPVAAGQPANLPPAARAATQDAQQALAAAQMSTAAANAAQALADATAAQVALTRAAATMDAAPAAAPPAPSGQPAGRAAGPISTVTGRGDRQDADGGAPVDRPVTAAGRPAAGQFIGLPERDRQAIQQSQGELYPAEYGALVEQYLRNLADVTATGPTP